VLKPGGRLLIGDILISKEMPQKALNVVALWTGCIAGGLPEADLLKVFREAGFENIEILQRYDIFEDVPNPSSALEFGPEASVSARKSQLRRMNTLRCNQKIDSFRTVTEMMEENQNETIKPWIVLKALWPYPIQSLLASYPFIQAYRAIDRSSWFG
jgi:hypothetical protein